MKNKNNFKEKNTIMKKKYMQLVVLGICFSAVELRSDTYITNNCTWTYHVSNGKAIITQVSDNTVSDIHVPKQIEGYQVVEVGGFGGLMVIDNVYIPEGVEKLSAGCFYQRYMIKNIYLPKTFKVIGDWLTFDCGGVLHMTVDKTSSLNNPYLCRYAGGFCLTANGIPLSFPYAGVSWVRCNRNEASYWIRNTSISAFGGFLNLGGGAVTRILCSEIRSADKTIMDVRYMVDSNKSFVKVRTLAFEDGERSFAKVVRPETFIEGTEVNIGDNVKPNSEHTISWRVSSDWTTKLAKVKFEVLAMEGDLVPLELMTIPASDQYGKMKISWNALNDSQLFDALLWLVASKDPELSLSAGVLRANGTIVAQNSGFANNAQREAAAAFIFSKMGYQRLTGAQLNYANQETRLGLTPSGSHQYAYKMVP